MDGQDCTSYGNRQRRSNDPLDLVSPIEPGQPSLAVPSVPRWRRTQVSRADVPPKKDHRAQCDACRMRGRLSVTRSRDGSIACCSQLKVLLPAQILKPRISLICTDKTCGVRKIRQNPTASVGRSVPSMNQPDPWPSVPIRGQIPGPHLWLRPEAALGSPLASVRWLRYAARSMSGFAACGGSSDGRSGARLLTA